MRPLHGVLSKILTRKKQGGWLFWLGGYRRAITLTASANTASIYNIYTQCGSPTDVVDVIFTINSGVGLFAGLTTGVGFVSGSTMKIINNGSVFGLGGSGATGGSSDSTNVYAPLPGGNGGDAINLTIDTTLDNTGGNIFGGGGGGGGGGVGTTTNPPLDNVSAGGGGGGGGQGSSGGGGAGTVFAGSFGAPGTGGSNALNGAGGSGATPYGAGFPPFGGDGQPGGTWGVAGASGSAGGTGSGLATTGSAGGAGGFAIRKNGRVCTITGGNNGAQIKGSVA